MNSQEKPVNILIVDDNIGDVGLLREALREECPGCEIFHLENGELALEYLSRQGQFVNRLIPDLLILDLNLPRIDGHEVLRFVRATPWLNRLSVSILSSSPHEIARAVSLNPSYLFQKPFDLDEFLSLAKDILRRFRLDQAIRAV
jgi:DNA-binding response OmpR family regulator